MRTIMTIVALASLLAAGHAQARETGEIPGSALKAVERLNRDFVKAVTARDSTAVANMYATDAVVLPPNMPRITGRQAIQSLWASFMRDPAFRLEPGSDRVFASGDLIVDVGTYHMSVTGPGAPAQDTGKYVTVFQRSQGHWLIVVDTFNSDLPGTHP